MVAMVETMIDLRKYQGKMNIGQLISLCEEKDREIARMKKYMQFKGIWKTYANKLYGIGYIE